MSSDAVLANVLPGSAPADDAVDRRWRRWRKKGRAHERLVGRRLRWVGALAALGLAIWLLRAVLVG